MATPILTTTPGLTAHYNVGMAETFSWVPMEGAGRPLFARATYLANASDISVSLSANDLNLNIDEVEDLLKDSITLLNTLTANTNLIEAKQNTTNSLLSSQLGQSGFDFIVAGETAAAGPYTTVQIASAAKISAIAATNSTIGQLTSFELPANFSFNGPITSVTLQYGAAFVYKL